MIIRLPRKAQAMNGLTGSNGKMMPCGVTTMGHAAADHGKVTRGEGEDGKCNNDKLANVNSHVGARR